MTEMNNPSAWYSKRIDETGRQLSDIKVQINRVSIFRVVLFLAGVIGVVCFFHSGMWAVLLTVCCTFLPFLVLVKYHNRLYCRRDRLEAQLRLNQLELGGLQGDYSAFDEGTEFIDPEHLYSYDLDIFGRKSLFQAINRTCTHIGRQILAGWMQKHLTDKKEIETRQECVSDLSGRTAFREDFQVTGSINKGERSDEAEIRRWSNAPSVLQHLWWVRLCLWGVPVVNATLLLLGLARIISLSWFGLCFMSFVILSFGLVHRITVMQDVYGKRLKTLDKYARLITLVKRQTWKASALQQLADSLDIDGHSPADALAQLSRELDRLDLRNNQLLYIILEGSLFFQLRQAVRIERWKERYGNHLMHWLETVGEMDALCSLSTFAYNHPAYACPAISDKPFSFMARNMGHPLMPENKCVRNDVSIPSRPFFLVITGANMAGKSTYLRTIGVNYLLACMGCPVCCDALTLYPARLFTSLCTTDSLSDNESYFFAELKRLKRIIGQLNEGKELFIILDEILRGTNSVDKQKGSLDLIRQFMRLNTDGVIATHDLLLATLAGQFPENIRNYCFEADIRDNELAFSYRLREGVAQNMNACFLMRKMGITVAD